MATKLWTDRIELCCAGDRLGPGSEDWAMAWYWLLGTATSFGSLCRLLWFCFCGRGGDDGTMTT
eukprot:scaffold248420_cov82-Cyclotella_meneghiniana.AAC.6